MEIWKRNLYATALAELLVMVGFTSVMPFIPLYLQTLGVKTKEEAALWTGIMVALSFIVMAVASPIWGTLADRHGRKSMLLRSMMAGALIVLALSFTTEVWQVFGLRIAQGAFAGSVTAAMALVATITPRERMGFSLGLMQTSVFAGQSFGPLIGGFLAEHLGFRSAFFITSSLMFLASGLLWWLVKEQFVRQVAISKVANSKGSGKALLGDWAEFFGQKQFLVMAIVLAMVQFSSLILSPVLPIFIQTLHSGVLKELGLGVSAMTGLIFGLTGFTSAISAVICGRLSDKIGHRRILIISTLGAALLCIPQMLVDDTFQLLILRGLTGLFIGGIIPSANAIVSQLTPRERRGAAYGVIQSVTSLGMAAGPITGAIVAATADARLVFAVTAVSLLFVSFWVSKVVRPNAITLTVPPTQAQPVAKTAL